MAILALERYFYGVPGEPDSATLGFLRWGSKFVYSLEDRWNDNAVGDSCIPDGLYRCRPRRFNRGGYEAIEVTGVPSRSLILFHKGNVARHVQGCIVVGMRPGVLDDPSGADDIAVLGSEQAFALLMADWGGIEFDLDVKPIPPLAGARLGP